MASTVAGCIELLRALAPEFSPRVVDSLEEVAIGVAWLEHADPLVRAPVESATLHFPRRQMIDLPLAERTEHALFMREVADVHRGLYPERGDEYGENVRWKLERCNEVTDSEVAAAERTRDEYRSRCDELLAGVDLLLTPTVPILPPPADSDEREIRDTATRFTYPFNVLGRPVLALPCGEASVQLVGRHGEDALVLAAGALLASLI